MEGLLREKVMATVGDKGYIEFSDFQTIIEHSSAFFVERMFHAIDVDRKGGITFEEFWAGVGCFQTRDTRASAEFLFRLIDEDNSGTLQLCELKNILAVSLESSGTSSTEDLDELAGMLRSMFLEGRDCQEESDGVTFEEFERVVKMYPDMFSGLYLGGVNVHGQGQVGKQGKDKENKNKKSVIRKCMSWMQCNPKLTFIYALLYAMVFGLFSWMFVQYAGDCEKVDLSAIDEESGVSRAQVMEFANQWRQQHDLPPITVRDMKCMSFSQSMAENDPMQCQAARKRILLGWMLPVAKGAGQAMKGIFTIILLPVSRNLITVLQKSFLKHILPFYDAVEVHKNLGRVGFFLAWLHTLCYVVIVYRWQHDDLYKKWSYAFPRYSPEKAADIINGDPEADMYKMDGVPSYLYRSPSDQPSALTVLGTWFGITGVILIVVYTIACAFALDYPKKLKIFNPRKGDQEAVSWGRKQVLAFGKCLRNFNNFWYTHHLFAIFYVCLLLHPLPHIPNGKNEWGKSDSWLWASVPIALYLLERFVRFLRAVFSNPVAMADISNGNVVHLKVLNIIFLFIPLHETNMTFIIIFTRLL